MNIHTKKTLPITAAIVIAFGSSSVLAEGPIDGKIYGKINLSVINIDDGTDKAWEIANASSRLGFKGNTEIKENLNVIYKLEYGIYPDDTAKDNTPFTQRNAYVGLKGVAGKIILGRHDTPFKTSQGKIDMFNNLKNGDLKNILSGEVRAKNAIMYTSPSFEGASITALLQPGEKAGTDKEDGIADGKSVSLNYKRDAMYFAVAMDDAIKDKDAVRATALYKGKGFGAGALWQQSEPSDGSKDAEDAFVISGYYKMDTFKFKAQYATSDETRKGNTQIAFGVDYELSKMTKTFAYYSAIEDDAKKETNVFGLGIEHNF
ncbi:MAG: porin [Gammaproteobacteria bacterium]|nr:porin [Gammaproteobacteria bacterium]